jgi:hypothetical protein
MNWFAHFAVLAINLALVAGALTLIVVGYRRFVRPFRR